MTKNLVIIPARGGSKGISHKNIKTIAGKPLIAWSIEQALSTSTVDRVIVSTDCKEIKAIAKEFGAEVPFLRPSELASDTATTEPVITHAINWLRKEESYCSDNIVLLQPTSPIRYRNRITDALKKIENEDVDSLFSVVEAEIFLWTDLNNPRSLYDFKNRPRRQDIKESELIYRENGSIYITKTGIFEQLNNRLTERSAALLMSTEEGVDIDTYIDWEIAECILIRLIKEKKLD